MIIQLILKMIKPRKGEVLGARRYCTYSLTDALTNSDGSAIMTTQSPTGVNDPALLRGTYILGVKYA
jgi:hypothetical protein